MPSFDLVNAYAEPLLLLTTIGTVFVGSVAIVYSIIFAGGRFVKPRQVQARAVTAIATSVLVIVLAALDIYLAFSS